jgi:hypothetical protein
MGSPSLTLAFGDHGELFDHARGGGGDLHGGLLALDHDQRLARLDPVAGRDQHLDDVHFLELADVRHADDEDFGHG